MSMRVRQQVMLSLASSIAVITIAGWMLWRYTPRSLPLPRATLALLAATVVLLPLIGIPISRWLHAPDNTTRVSAFFKSSRGRILWGVAIALLFLTIVPVMTRGPRASILAGMLGNVPMVMAFLGIALLSGCVTRRGEAPLCAACGYELSGAPAPESAGDRCPECGAEFRRPGGTVRGRRTFDRRLLILGVLCLSAPLAWFVLALRSPLTASRLHMPLLPTDSLIKEVTAAPRGFTMDEWTELRKRVLSSEQEVRLARGLLELRSRRGFLGSEAEGWLVAFAASGAMPSDLAGRYYSEWMDLWLVVPDRMRLGSAARAGVAARYLGGGNAAPGKGLEAQVLFAGFGIGDEHPARGGITESIYGLMMQPHELYDPRRRAAAERPQALGEYSPCISIVAERPGPLRIRATAWVVIVPQGPGFTVTWRDDGSPVLPSDTVWSRRIDLERTIRVDP